MSQFQKRMVYELEMPLAPQPVFIIDGHEAFGIEIVAQAGGHRNSQTVGVSTGR